MSPHQFDTLKIIGISTLACLTGCKEGPSQQASHLDQPVQEIAENEQPADLVTDALETTTDGEMVNSEQSSILPIYDLTIDADDELEEITQTTDLAIDNLIDAGKLEKTATVINSYIAKIDTELSELRLTAENEKKQAMANAMHILPSARNCSNEWGLTVFGEFIYWKTFEDELILGLLSSSNSQTSIEVELANFHPNFKPGFRVGLGYNCVFDDWSVNAIYTRYRNHQTIQSPFVQLLYNLSIPGQESQVSASEFSARWKLLYDVLDLELSRDFYVSKYLALRPFISARGARIRQRINTGVLGMVPDDFAPSGSVSASVAIGQRLKFWGIGPRIGLDTHWLFGKSGWGFLLNGEASILYSGFHYTFDTQETDQTIPVTQTNLLYDDVYKRIRFNGELFAGFDYHHCWKDSACSLALFAGYSVIYWWNQNQFVMNSPLFYPNGDLAFHGIDFGFELEF